MHADTTTTGTVKNQPSLVVMSLLIFASVVSSTLLIPAVRPFVAARHGGAEWVMHSFMTVNMLGAIVGAPLMSMLADRTGARRRLVVVLALLDGVFLYACSLPVSVHLMLSFRTLQGAANVGGLSILLGMVRRNGRSNGAAMGAAGASVMLAVAAGPPLGTLVLTYGGGVAPLQVGSLLPFAVAIGCSLSSFPRVLRAKRGNPLSVLRAQPLLGLPILWVGVERFAIGCFVVSFALYANRVLGLPDVRVGMLFSWFLLPFALATYPMGRFADRMNRARMVKIGMFGYGLCFLVLGVTPVSLLPLLMLCCGLSSAAIYAPSLCFAASLVGPEVRATSMSFLNAAGSLGMMLGTACAGVFSAMLQSVTDDLWLVYLAIFCVAGVAQWVALGLSLPGLSRLDGEAERTCSLRPTH